MDTAQEAETIVATSSTCESLASTTNAETAIHPSASQEPNVDCEDEQSISRDVNKMYMENYQPYDYDANDTLTQERNEIEKAVENQQITPGRAKLQLWLYRSMRIVMTDGRILIGIFLCTDSDANVILGVCSEYTKNGGDERMLGLVMVPGTFQPRLFHMKVIPMSYLNILNVIHFRTSHRNNASGYTYMKLNAREKPEHIKKAIDIVAQHRIY